jgi:hypothetical protein
MMNKGIRRLHLFCVLIFLFLFKPIFAEEIFEQNFFDEEFFEDFTNEELVFYGDANIFLDRDAFAYAIVDVKKIRPIFSLVPVTQLSSREARMIIDNTEMALAAIFPGDSGRYFQMAGFGSYPNFAAAVALAINRNWRYAFSGKDSYWYSSGDRLSVKISPDEVYLVGWRAAHANPVPEEPGVKVPEGFTAFRHQSGRPAPLSLWLENHDVILNRILLSEMAIVNLPIDRLFLNLYLLENNAYKADLLLQVKSFFQWENLYVELSAIRAGSPLKPLFFARPPVQNGYILEFESALLSEDDIISLMAMFLRNWK